MQPSSTGASIIVPTFREEPNIKELVERTLSATSKAGIDAEVIIVDDDSQDGTEELVHAMSKDRCVRVIVRRGQRGLASAVLTGLGSANFDRLVVLDADLQHPPEMIPELLAMLERNEHDFVIGTRYGEGSSIDGAWPWWRRLASRIATGLARPLAPMSDPMSGFFALRKETLLGAEMLDPVGYKIGLELFVKGKCSRPAEVPIRFAARGAGTSKLGVAAQVQYLWHLGKLYRFKWPWLVWVGAAILVGAAISIVNVLYVLNPVD